MRKHRNFPWRKRNKRERRIIETLINNVFVKKKVFCYLNAWSVSNITGDIIFLTRIFRTLIQTINISQMTRKLSYFEYMTSWVISFAYFTYFSHTNISGTTVMQIFPNVKNGKLRFYPFIEFYVIHLKHQGLKFWS